MIQCGRCSKTMHYVGFEKNAKGLFYYYKCEFCGNFERKRKTKQAPINGKIMVISSKREIQSKLIDS